VQGQLEKTQRIQQELQEGARQLREHLQQAGWEQGDHRLGEVLKKDRLVEEIYPNQQPQEALRQTLKDLYLMTLVERVRSGHRADQIAEEFADQLRQCSEAVLTEDLG
jgi:hypothetical protein